MQKNEFTSVVPPYSCSDLTQDLRRLQVGEGDILFVHSSFKALGPVTDGAQSVIEALEAAIGPEGLLLMPSFNLVQWEATARNVGSRDHALDGWLDYGTVPAAGGRVSLRPLLPFGCGARQRGESVCGGPS